MNGSEATTSGREAWLLHMRREGEREADALDPDRDDYWDEIGPTHRSFTERFLSELPPDGSVLDAACGPGRYFPMVLESGRMVVGVDHADAYLADLGLRFPNVHTEKRDLEDLPYRDEFDGVMCVDAMEFIAPEDWAAVLDGFRRALRPRGWLYFTVELVPTADVRARNDEARRSGLPVVDGEVIWAEPEPYYHYYPGMERVRNWLAEAGFAIEREVEGPWQDSEYAYHHVLARRNEGS